MERIEKSIDVHVPVSVAYNQWTQFEEFPRFMEGVLEVRQLDDRHMHWVADVGGKQKEWDAEISEQVPDRRIAWHSMGGTRNDGSVEFSPISPDHTHVTVTMDYDPEGFVENVGDFFGATSHRVEEDLERFKAFVESRGHESGAWRGSLSGMPQGAAEAQGRAGMGQGDESAFRTHYQSHYASLGGAYEDYDPAYRYGYGLRDRYADRDWNAIEGDVQRDWEWRQPGTWERFKEAVRAGWERTKRTMH